jgi:hypothetical protein
MYKIELIPTPGTTFDPYMIKAIEESTIKKFKEFEDDLIKENGTIRIVYGPDDKFDYYAENISEPLAEKIMVFLHKPDRH